MRRIRRPLLTNFANMHSSARHLVPMTDQDKLSRHGHVGYTCSCQNFWHCGKCKHSLAYAITMGEIEVPRQYDSRIVGHPTGPGRPKKAKPHRRVKPANPRARKD